MSLNTFKNTDPGIEGVRLYLASDNLVTALTVSTLGCDGKNYAPSLEVLESITINDIELHTTTKEVFDNYYFFETEPILFDPESKSLITGSCTGLIFNPFLQELDFTYNDYNALLGNSSNLKQSTYIYEVDRKSDQSIPSNLNAILLGSATKAEVQDSNYSSIGLINGRYNGSKTSVSDYGESPALNPSIFNGSLYTFSKTATAICSESVDERKITELYYTTNQLVVGATNTEYPGVRVQYIMEKTEDGYESFSGSDTTIVIYQDLDVNTGDILRSKVGSELLKVNSITKSGTGNQVTSSLEVDRQYYSEYTGNTSTLNPIAGTSKLNIVKVLGDTIYAVDSSTPYKVTEKKLWVEETQEIFTINDFGVIVYLEQSCST